MPYIPVTNEADRSFARDADAMSDRVDNRGWQASNIFDDNEVAMATLPYKRAMRRELMDRAQVLEASQRTRNMISRDDKMVADEEEFNAFNDGLSEAVGSDAYAKNLGDTYMKNPTNPYLKAAHDALNSTATLDDTMKRKAFTTKQQEYGIQQLDNQIEDENATRAMKKETMLVGAKLGLDKMKDAAANLQVDFNGTLYDFQQEMGASGLPEDHQMLLGRIAGSLNGSPEEKPALVALTRLARGYSLKDSANPYLESLAEAHRPAMLAIAQQMGKRGDGKPMSPFETDPEATKRRNEILGQRPDLANDWEDIQSIQQMSMSNKQTVENLKTSLRPALEKILANAGNNTPEALRAFRSDIGGLTMLANSIAGLGAKSAREYDTQNRIFTDKSKMDVLESRMALAKDTTTRAELALKFAQERADLNTEQKMRDHFYGLKKVQTMSPEKFRDYTKQVDGWIKDMNLPTIESSGMPSSRSSSSGYQIPGKSLPR